MSKGLNKLVVKISLAISVWLFSRMKMIKSSLQKTIRRQFFVLDEDSHRICSKSYKKSLKTWQPLLHRKALLLTERFNCSFSDL